MGHKIFVSYKYADTNVAALPGQVFSSARDYVTALEQKLDRASQIYKGESDGEDLSCLTEEQIWAKLRDRIYDTSVTIVFISRGMKEPKPEWWQWIPWEISYSLKEISRDDRTSHTNAMLATVLPDYNGSYAYAVYKRTCCQEHCTWYKTQWLFEIMYNNTFNRKSASIKSTDIKICDNQHERIHYREFSYMPIVTWEQFVENPTKQIERVCDLRDNHIEEYDTQKVVEL